MRVVWKDSGPTRDPRNYRGYRIYGMHNGWATSLPGDKYLYSSIDDCCNMIDKAIGGYSRYGTNDRIGGRIKIVGERDE
jgi:hypothetical protein